MSKRIIISARLDEWAPYLGEELNAHGFDVTIAETFSKMRELLSHIRYDIAIPTNNDPTKGEGMHELITGLRHLHPELGIVVITGFAELREAIECKKCGADDFIGLPFDFEDVIETLNRVLSSKTA